jgi:hypothetical protein
MDDVGGRRKRNAISRGEESQVGLGPRPIPLESNLDGRESYCDCTIHTREI